MVVTRRSANNSLASNQEDDNISSRGSSLRGSPPPPPPPPSLPQLNLVGALNQQQQQQMATIHEEVDIIGGNNNNNNDAAILAPPPVVEVQQQQPTTQYLQIRVFSQSQHQPTRIHRRHHHRQSTTNNSMQPQQQRRSIKRGVKSILSSPSHGKYEEGEIVKVLIPSNGFASEGQLADILSQASSSSPIPTTTLVPPNDIFECYDDDYSMDEYYNREDIKISGMWRESDRVFIPLSIIYANPRSFTNEVLCLHRPPLIPKQQRPLLPDSSATTAAKRRSIFITFLEVMGILVVLMASYKATCIDYEYLLEIYLYKIERGFFTVLNFPFWLFDILIEFPLRELYRHGPSIIGWEGEPLPKICARITYHGDELFWSRNIEECERIYAAKELAALQVRKPIVVAFLIGIIFYMIKSIVEARALSRRERIDPNVVETYRAIQMLTRQLRRAANGR